MITILENLFMMKKSDVDTFNNNYDQNWKAGMDALKNYRCCETRHKCCNSVASNLIILIGYGVVFMIINFVMEKNRV